MLKKTKHTGFTLLEVMIVVAIVAFTALSISSFNLATVKNTHYTTVSQEIKQAILTSQSLSRRNYLDQKSGVAFESDSFIEFTSDTYDELDSSNQITELFNGISLSNPDFGGSNVLYFEKNSGLPINPGQVTLNNSDGRQVLIQVDANGVTNLTYL